MEPSPVVVDWTAIIISIATTMLPILGAIATYLINRHIKDKALCATLDNAVNNSVGILQQVAAGARPVTRIDPSIRASVGADIAPAVQYVVNQASEAVKRFDNSPEKIAEKIVSRVGLQNIATNLATTASAGSAEIVPPLAPTVAASAPVPAPATSVVITPP